MFENIKHTLDKGIEFAFATTEKIEKAAKEFANDNNLNKEEAKKLLNQWIKKSNEIKKSLEDQIVEIQKTTIKKMNLVTMSEYKTLELRIQKLEDIHKSSAKHARIAKPVRKAPIKKRTK